MFLQPYTFERENISQQRLVKITLSFCHWKALRPSLKRKQLNNNVHALNHYYSDQSMCIIVFKMGNLSDLHLLYGYEAYNYLQPWASMPDRLAAPSVHNAAISIVVASMASNTMACTVGGSVVVLMCNVFVEMS